MKNNTLSGVSTAPISSRGLQSVRRLVGLLMVCMGLCVTNSCAQTCPFADLRVISTKAARISIPFSTNAVNGDTILDTFSYTASYANCSGFNNPTMNFLLQHGHLWPFNSSFTSSFDTSGVNFKTFARCKLFLGPTTATNCFDSSGKSTQVSVDNTDGIWMNVRINITGIGSDGNNCITVTGFTPNSSPSTSYMVHTISARATTCVSITVKADVVLGQNASFKPANVVWMSADRLGGSGSTSFMQINTFANSIPVTTPGINFNSGAGVKLLAQPSTCALSLSNTFINFGELKPEQVSNTPAGATVISKPLTVNISNCPEGFATGKNKILQWVFANPNTDRTRMENATGANGAKGVSAQIQADQRFDVLIPTTVLPNIVTSGQSYITSGTTSNNQSLNYQVNIIRNSDPVVLGNFSSTATVTLSYK